MSVLVDWQIQELCTLEEEKLIQPFHASQLNPCSYDILVGDSGVLEVDGRWIDIDLTDFKIDSPFWLAPGKCVLLASRETFNIPRYLCAQFRLKSSRGREFYEHMEAGFCDPGWSGSVLTMEIKNNTQHTRLPLYPGLRIGQMVFQRLDALPYYTYDKTGRYNNDKKVSRSKG